MIRYVIVLVAGLGIGYTYGYLQQGAGRDNMIDSALVKVGVRHAARHDDDDEPASGDAARRMASDSLRRRAADQH